MDENVYYDIVIRWRSFRIDNLVIVRMVERIRRRMVGF